MRKTPAISVVMPVYNYGHYIRDSIDSILAQTMSDFELIVVNDGSSDNSGEIAHSYLDRRIRIIDFDEQSGCYPARNTGMKIAKGKYICVMDADDVSLPDRLEQQYRFLEENTEFGVIGGAFQMMGNQRVFYRETDFETIKLLILRFCYLCHATCMIRTSLVREHGLYYNESYTYASDHDWIARASSLFPVTNMNEIVYKIRTHPQQISTAKSQMQSFFIDQIRLKQLSFFGIEPTETEKELHLALIKGLADERFGEKQVDRWIERLSAANLTTRRYSQNKLQKFLQSLRYVYAFNLKEA